MLYLVLGHELLIGLGRIFQILGLGLCGCGGRGWLGLSSSLMSGAMLLFSEGGSGEGYNESRVRDRI